VSSSADAVSLDQANLRKGTRCNYAIADAAAAGRVRVNSPKRHVGRQLGTARPRGALESGPGSSALRWSMTPYRFVRQVYSQSYSDRVMTPAPGIGNPHEMYRYV
jgi:hypothetical protein